MDSINLGTWEGFKKSIKNHLDNDNLDNFFSWPILINTMIAGVDDIEFETLKKSKYWNIWELTLDEPSFRANSFSKFPSSSTNNIHHAYSLDVMMNNFGVKLNEFNNVLDFGGGYGNTSRLFKKWGYDNKKYIIYDIPELSIIQKHYLNKCDIFDVILTSGFDKHPIPEKQSLFLGLWSITETPVYERKKILELLNFFEYDHIFIAMGLNFYNENNLEWLNLEIIPKLKELNHETNLIKIEHGDGMFYFLSKKKT